MDHFRITQTAAGFHVEGFPDASKVIRISGPKDSSAQGEQRYVSIGMNVFGRLRVRRLRASRR